jgi:hypothetical protein
LLLAQRLYSLRIDPMRLTHERPIRFDTFENYCALTQMTVEQLSERDSTLDGLTIGFTRDGVPGHVILFHSGMEGRPRLRFTLAHELGHIYLGHEDDGLRQEREANRFAAALLIPPVLARELLKRSGGALTADDLAAVFGISRTAAALRLTSLRDYHPTPEDLALLDKLGGFLPDLSGPVITV